MRVEDVLVHLQITFGQVSRSCVLLVSHLDGIPIAPAVGGSAADVKMLFYPEGEATILVLRQIVAATLGAELVPEPIEHWCQVLLGEFLVLLPCSYDGRLEFLFG